MWYKATFLVSLAIPALAIPGPAGSGSTHCKDIKIPVKVNVPRYVFKYPVKDNWDAAALTFNLTRRDFADPEAPTLVESDMTESRQSTYQVSGTLCGTGKTTLVLTHGILESNKYWNPNFPGGEQYSFVEAAVKAGYSVLSYDRIGVGASSTVSSSEDAQFQVQSAVLNQLITYIRKDTPTSKVVLIGHSYGSYVSSLSASQMNVDGLVLTGFSGSFDYFGPFITGAGFRVARLQNPKRWGHLDSGYLTSSDVFATAFIYFKEPYFNHAVAEWTHNVGSEPFAVGELLSILGAKINYSNIKAPVLVLQGQYDVSACGGDCVGFLNTTAALFSSSSKVQIVDDLPAGHNPNLHFSAQQSFQIVFEFLKGAGL